MLRDLSYQQDQLPLMKTENSVNQERKPEKYGLTFYAMVGSKYRYCYIISDNGTGNKKNTPACDRYTHFHKALKNINS